MTWKGKNSLEKVRRMCSSDLNSIIRLQFLLTDSTRPLLSSLGCILGGRKQREKKHDGNPLRRVVIYLEMNIFLRSSLMVGEKLKSFQLFNVQLDVNDSDLGFMENSPFKMLNFTIGFKNVHRVTRVLMKRLVS